jgi:hypothetical protein
VLYTPPGIGADEFHAIVDSMHKEYYLRPAYIFRQFRQIRSYSDIDRMARGFLAITGL